MTTGAANRRRSSLITTTTTVDQHEMGRLPATPRASILCLGWPQCSLLSRALRSATRVASFSSTRQVLVLHNKSASLLQTSHFLQYLLERNDSHFDASLLERHSLKTCVIAPGFSHLLLLGLTENTGEGLTAPPRPALHCRADKAAALSQVSLSSFSECHQPAAVRGSSKISATRFFPDRVQG